MVARGPRSHRFSLGGLVFITSFGTSELLFIT